jgi:hypothetical protein
MAFRHPREGGDPFKYQSELKLLAWMDPRLRGDDDLRNHNDDGTPQDLERHCEAVTGMALHNF